MPLISSETLARVLVEHLTSQATLTLLTAISEQPSDFGRVVRDTDGRVREVVEIKRATEEQKGISEVNSGVYCLIVAGSGRICKHCQRMPQVNTI